MIIFFAYVSISDTILPGLPITILPSGIFPFTTAQAPIIQSFPIVVPGNKEALAPTKELFPIFIGLLICICLSTLHFPTACKDVSTE